MKIRSEEIYTVKAILFVQGFLLLCATCSSFISDYEQGIMDNKTTEVTSRFLELMQKENSISDSRLEVIERILLINHLKPNGAKLDSLKTDFDKILNRYDEKLSGYKPDDYRKISSEAKIDLAQSEQMRFGFKVLSIIFTVLAFLINIYAVWKINKFPLQSAP